MKSFIAAIAALAVTAVADSTIDYTTCEGDCGYAKIISYCDEDIYFLNQPSQGDAVGTTVLKSGDSYSQIFTAMPNTCGWSMKLSPDSSFPSDNTQQYEYTWTGLDTSVWYDMSYVNGNPYPSWNFTSSDDSLCDPTDHAYAYSTDDAYGMQAMCYTSVTLTLHLCPENAGGSSSSSSSSSASSSSEVASATSASASSASSESSAYSAPASTSSSSVAAYTSAASSSSQTTFATSTSSAYTAPASSSTHTWGGYGNKVEEGNSGSLVVEASASTSTAVSTENSGGVVVTETQVQIVTQVQTVAVTARDAAPTHAHKLRHEHRHPHGGRA